MTDRRRLPLEPDPEREVRDEIGFYLEERTREFEARGMGREEAVRAARAAFGDPERVAAEVAAIDRQRRRDEGRGWTMETILRETGQAARALLRQPTFTAVVVLTLGLGIGAVTAVFSVVNASLIRALPFADADGLVFLQGAFDAPEGPQIRGASLPEARDWESMSRSFEEVAAYDQNSLTLTGTDGAAERVRVETVDEGYLELFRVEPITGRGFAAADHVPENGAPVALVGESLWRQRWAGDPGLVGRTIVLDGDPFTVVGILPRGFPGASLTTDVWIPFASVMSARAIDNRGDRFAGVVARLAPGVTPEDARRDLDGVAARLEEQHGEINLDRIALVTPMRDAYLDTTRTLLLVVLGATGLLLLIAASNVANLLLVRASARSGDLLLRRALGASRIALGRAALAESLLLAAAGTALGSLFGVWGADALAAAMPEALLPAYVEVAPDATVLAAVAAVMALVGIGTGLAPALMGAQSELATGLRRTAGGRGAGRSRLQSLLVVGEVALALILLVGAGLMVRSLRAQLAVDPGFEPGPLLATSLMLPASRYPEDAERRALMDRIVARVAAEPGVASVTFGSDAPLRGNSSAAYLWTAEGGTVEDRIRFYFHRVQPGWFETLGVDLLAGRALNAADGEGGLDVAVISRAMAERHFPGEDPIGRSLIVGRPDGSRLTIVGVADDVRWRDLTTDLVAGPTDVDVYIPWRSLTGYQIGLVVAARGDPAALALAVDRAVRDVDPQLVPYDVAPMTEVLRTQTAQGRFGSLLLSAFSAIAAALAGIGLYGVLSFTVGRRTREIAVRMAMGADGSRVRRMVVADGLRLAVLGLALGVAIALVAVRSLEAFLFGVTAVDATTYALVAGLMGGVAALAAWIPARRATRVDPNRALASG